MYDTQILLDYLIRSFTLVFTPRSAQPMQERCVWLPITYAFSCGTHLSGTEIPGLSDKCIATKSLDSGTGKSRSSEAANRKMESL